MARPHILNTTITPQSHKLLSPIPTRKEEKQCPPVTPQECLITSCWSTPPLHSEATQPPANKRNSTRTPFNAQPQHNWWMKLLEQLKWGYLGLNKVKYFARLCLHNYPWHKHAPHAHNIIKMFKLKAPFLGYNQQREKSARRSN